MPHRATASTLPSLLADVERQLNAQTRALVESLAHPGWTAETVFPASFRSSSAQNAEYTAGDDSSLISAFSSTLKPAVPLLPRRLLHSSAATLLSDLSSVIPSMSATPPTDREEVLLAALIQLSGLASRGTASTVSFSGSMTSPPSPRQPTSLEQLGDSTGKSLPNLPEQVPEGTSTVSLGVQKFRHGVERVLRVIREAGDTANVLERLVSQRRITDAVLAMAADLASQSMKGNGMIATILRSTCTLLRADRCTLYTIHGKELASRMYLGGTLSKEIRIPINSGIAGFVATSGETVNISDAYDDPRFNKTVDVDTGFRTRAILCMPIKADDKIVAVLQCVNKIVEPSSKQTPVFSEDDEQIFEAFSHFAGLSIRNATLYSESETNHMNMEIMLGYATELSQHVVNYDLLLKDIIDAARKLVSADRCALFLMSESGNELVAPIEGGTIRVAVGEGVVGKCALQQKPLLIPDAYKDPSFNQKIDEMTGYKTRSLLCMPIMVKGQLVGVAQLVNKWEGSSLYTAMSSWSRGVDQSSQEALHSGNDSLNATFGPDILFLPFTVDDMTMFGKFSSFIATTIKASQQHRALSRAHALRDAVLDSVSHLVQADVRDIHSVIDGIMMGAKRVCNCDRVSFFMRDKEKGELWSRIASDTAKIIRFPWNQGIAGHVASTGEHLNITDAYADERFNQAIDRESGYKTRTILCAPVSYEGEVVGVAQLVNKLRDEDSFFAASESENPVFTDDDLNALNVFGNIAGVCLRNAALYEFVAASGEQALQLSEGFFQKSSTLRRNSTHSDLRLATQTEVTTALDATAVTEDEIKLLRSKDFPIFDYHWLSSTKADRLLSFGAFLFEDLGLVEKFQIPLKTIYTFILTVRGKYRRVPYHSFTHAFDVTHTVYQFLTIGGCRRFFTDLEVLLLIVASFCHDIDHSGVNNSYHHKVETPLGVLSYVTGAKSVLEVHHCNLMIDILSLEPANVLKTVPQDLLPDAFKLMIQAILFTDAARHGEMLDLLRGLEYVPPSTAPEDIPVHSKMALFAAIIKAGDISNPTKNMSLSRLWGVAVNEEFYQQGDLEKERQYDVAEMFDRSAKRPLAKGQIDFINFVCKGFFELFAKINEPLQQWYEQLLTNLQEWTSLFEEMCKESNGAKPTSASSSFIRN